MKLYFRLIFFVWLGVLFLVPEAIGQIDLTNAKLFVAVSDKKALGRSESVLQEEVKKRTGRILEKVTKPSERSAVVLALESELSRLPANLRQVVTDSPALAAEGYKVYSHKGSGSVLIVGKDQRGLLYGVGRFLRKASLTPQKMLFPDDYVIATSPRFKVRGHQLGYRPKTNSYDAFTVAQFDQYIRELALFGANSIEILPPRTDDAPTSPHMKVPALEMVKEQSRIADSYGLDVWMWYPNLEKDYSGAATQKKELDEREAVFKVVPKIDALFAPGGDPGDLEPDELFPWMAKVAAVLNKYHPQAKIWISPQSFRPDQAWFDSFFEHVNKGYPWLGGIVFGPWVKVTMDEIKSRIPKDFPIRNYPDITHSIACQYPVPDWDKAWAVTLGREAVNPRPIDQKHIHNSLASSVIGSISYSEGTNDDVNKFVWSDQDWNPGTDVRETLEDYSRLFFEPRFAKRGADALLALEENSKGELAGKVTILQTLRAWQWMEKEATPQTLQNPRFQMGLIRAYYDEYIRQRLIYETHLEERAKGILANAGEPGIEAAIREAIDILESAWKKPIREDLKQKCVDLADSLYKSIGAQLTMSKHGAASGRGNFIDYIQYPLNDGPWLISQLREVQKLTDSRAKVAKLKELLERTNPGPGGFYNHMASLATRHRITSEVPWEKDPGSLSAPRTGFGLSLPDNSWYTEIPGVPVKVPLAPAVWNNQIEVLYDTPLKVKYDHLEPGAEYKIRVVYTGRFKSNVRLRTSRGTVIHDYIKVGQQPVYEFDIPQEDTKSGSVELIWNCKEAERGVQVAEIWILRK